MGRVKLISVYLAVFGMAQAGSAIAAPFVLGGELMWSPRNLPTDLMISSIYFALGLVMILASRAPLSHKSFIDFVIISSLLHAVVMFVFAQKPLHIYVDAVFMGLNGLIPLVLYPWGLRRILRY